MFIDSCTQMDVLAKYKVSMYGRPRQHIVIVSYTDDTLGYSCKFFEFVGILCSHVLKVLADLKIKIKIPEQYYIERVEKKCKG